MQVYEEITPQQREAEIRESEHVPARKTGGSFILFQAVLCLLLLLTAMMLKYLMPGLYDELRSKYDAEMERSVLITYDDISDS